MIEHARRTLPDQWISHEELGRRLNISDEEHDAAQARIQRRLREDAEDDQTLAEEEGAEATSGAGQRPPPSP